MTTLHGLKEDSFRRKRVLLLPFVLIRIVLTTLAGVIPGVGYLVHKLYGKPRTIHVDGSVEPGWEPVQQAYRKLLESGTEEGSAFSVYHNGRKVVDLWGGYADVGAYRYRQEDSTSLFYSVTKVVSSITMGVLVDRGLLNYKEPVSKYWPEFAQNGKGDITVECLLSHQAGLVNISEPYNLAWLRDDPETLGELLAKQAPIWEPGEAHGYHALTFGLYADQLVRRVDPQKRSLAQYFKEEIAEPHDIDFCIGEPREQFHRGCRETRLRLGWSYVLTTGLHTAYLFFTNAIYTWLRVGDIYLTKYIGNPRDWKPRRLNDPAYREIGSPASHGFGTARACAKLLSVLCKGDIAGKKLFSPEVAAALATPVSSGFDLVVMKDITYGPGTMMIEVKTDDGKTRPIVGHWGAGGQMGFTDPDLGLSWAYCTNYVNILHGFIVDHRYMALQNAMYKCILQFNKER